MGLEPQYAWHQMKKPKNKCQYMVTVDNKKRPCGRLTHNRWWCKEHHRRVTNAAGEDQWPAKGGYTK